MLIPYLYVTFFLLCRGKVVLGYSEIELCMKGSGYNFIHAADMMYCADQHLKSKSEEFATVPFTLKTFGVQINNLKISHWEFV